MVSPDDVSMALLGKTSETMGDGHTRRGRRSQRGTRLPHASPLTAADAIRSPSTRVSHGGSISRSSKWAPRSSTSGPHQPNPTTCSFPVDLKPQRCTSISTRRRSEFGNRVNSLSRWHRRRLSVGETTWARRWAIGFEKIEFPSRSSTGTPSTRRRVVSPRIALAPAVGHRHLRAPREEPARRRGDARAPAGDDATARGG